MILPPRDAENPHVDLQNLRCIIFLSLELKVYYNDLSDLTWFRERLELRCPICNTVTVVRNPYRGHS